MPADRVLDVPLDFTRTGQPSKEDWIASARWIVDLMCRTFGYDDLSEVSLLDVGCGTKLTKAFYELGLPVGRYVGIDVYGEMVTWLQQQVDDPRFAYHHLDAHNEMYNPGGHPLAGFDSLPVGDEAFDVICLYSVFTHLAPHDYPVMLRLLRPHVKPDGHLIYSLFVRPPTMGARIAEGDREVERTLATELLARISAGDAEVLDQVCASVDADPDSLQRLGGYIEAWLQQGPSELHGEIQRLRAEGGPLRGSHLREWSSRMPAQPVVAGGDPALSDVLFAERDFVDRIPDNPLEQAVYSEQYARELVEGTGWEIVALNDPVLPYIQHQMVCRPV